VAVVQYTFTHKQHEYRERNIHNNKNGAYITIKKFNATIKKFKTFTGSQNKKSTHNTAKDLRLNENPCSEVPSFLLSASGTVLHLQVYCEIVRHTESNEQHGKVTVLYWRIHYCQSCGSETRS
jgi:hypothetical protein